MKALARAKETGGRFVQIIRKPASEMQLVEESMAVDMGVPVVKLDVSKPDGEIRLQAERPWPELMATASGMADTDIHYQGA